MLVDIRNTLTKWLKNTKGIWYNDKIIINIITKKLEFKSKFKFNNT